MGKPKTWNISTTADRRAKLTKFWWDSGYFSAHMEVTFDARFMEFGFVSFSALCKISNFTILLKLCSSPNFHLIHTNFIQGTIIIQAVTFYGELPKIAKNMALEAFLTQDHMQLEFSVQFLPHFSFESIQTL